MTKQSLPPFYRRYTLWMQELHRIAQRHIERSCRTWAAYCAGCATQRVRLSLRQA